MYQHELTVPTLTQKVLFFCEMEGQLSDGNWENTRPDQHWVEWQLKWDQILVSGVDSRIGTNWWPKKSNYNFADNDLLMAVGYRCIFYGNLARQVPEKVERLLRDPDYNSRHAIPSGLEEYNEWADWSRGKPDHYSSKYLSKLDLAGFTREDFQNASYSAHYTVADLRNDCKVLKTAVRTQLGVNPKEVKLWQYEVRNALKPHFESMSTNQHGEIIVKRGYFYTFGFTSAMMQAKVEGILAEAKISAVVEAADHWAAWPKNSYHVATVRRE